MGYSTNNIPSDAELDLYRGKLANSLSHSPVLIEDIIDQLGIPVNILNCLLIELELAGQICRTSGNKVYRVVKF
ncbi:DprA-like winged helix domain-containing protein [Candidatus Bandiella euplotis]|uniref:DNA-protecting DprA C-terminal domain protein n=1 Tax=Candidatus Bandiella euplotis TaxID=1664265 RepID=A0ABZ0UKH5_9RICK|nr:Putative DNA-protecting DprA C-terminal domain protein [Candidatus Bandiella woodruffii]